MRSADQVSVICFCGGNGANSIAAELARQDFSLCCLVNGYDDGRSTGEIRRFFRSLGPSDIRKNHYNLVSANRFGSRFLRHLWSFRFPQHVTRQVALSAIQALALGRPIGFGLDADYAVFRGEKKAMMQAFLEHFINGLSRHEEGLGRLFSFSDCAIANCIYAGAVEAFGGDWYSAVATIEAMLGLEASVAPISSENRWLSSLTREGTVLDSEFKTDTYPMARIEDLCLSIEPIAFELQQELSFLSLERRVKHIRGLSQPPELSEFSSLRVAEADVIIYGPGTRSTSFFPTYLASGLGASIRRNHHAAKILVTNIGTENGVGYGTAAECLLGTVDYLRRSDDSPGKISDYVGTVLVNDPDDLRKEEGDFVSPTDFEVGELSVEWIKRSFESQRARGTHTGSLVVGELQRMISNRMDVTS